MRYFVTDGDESVVIHISTAFAPLACFRLTRLLEREFGDVFDSDSGNTLEWVRILRCSGHEVMIGYDEWIDGDDIVLILPKALGQDMIASIQARLSRLKFWY